MKKLTIKKTMVSKLIAIQRNEDEIKFIFDSSEPINARISENSTTKKVFLFNCIQGNDEVFSRLGINDPMRFYKSLGINANPGICPECSREDLEKVLSHLLAHYSIVELEEESIEDKPEDKKPNEWDWLF